MSMKILTIGRDESCNIVLSDSTVSRRHAILKIHATGKMEIISMGQNGTFVNGVKLKSDTAYPVTRKDVVSFAHVRQLDWNQIPDVQRYYRYGIMAVIITAIVVIQDMKDDTPRLPVIECQQEEKVLPEKEVAPQAEVKKKQDSLSEKKEKNEVSSCFFPKKKTKDKKEKNKKNGDKKENDSASKKEQAVPIIY
jgi:pSer/pThr/pTyr-binding forkhead associated (FHA) protein